jgi:hypothetical protein
MGLLRGLFEVLRDSPTMWREARGSVLRQQFDDVMMRIKGANYPAMRGFYGNIEGTIEELREAYNAASSSEHKAILEHCRKSMHQMWNRGDWPSVLGLSISCLNIESEHLPGEDAAYVKRETDKVIAEASAFLEKDRQ